jgi:hypothetical protein
MSTQFSPKKQAGTIFLNAKIQRYKEEGKHMVANQPLAPAELTGDAPSENTSGPESYWSFWHTLVLPALLITAGLIGLLFPPSFRLFTWIAIFCLLLLSSITIGHGTTNKWNGLLIDERNKISLSRFQMMLWILIVLSAFLSIALINVRINPLNALTINVPIELLALMGISTTSLVGAPLALSTKRDQVTSNDTRYEARWSDMFMGEEVANQGRLDVGKVQLFYFTIILAVAYIGALAVMFINAPNTINTLPSLNDGLVTLLGISHAGYLVNKAVPRNGNTNAPNDNTQGGGAGQ